MEVVAHAPCTKKSKKADTASQVFDRFGGAGCELPAGELALRGWFEYVRKCLRFGSIDGATHLNVLFLIGWQTSTRHFGGLSPRDEV